MNKMISPILISRHFSSTVFDQISAVNIHSIDEYVENKKVVGTSISYSHLSWIIF